MERGAPIVVTYRRVGTPAQQVDDDIAMMADDRGAKRRRAVSEEKHARPFIHACACLHEHLDDRHISAICR